MNIGKSLLLIMAVAVTTIISSCKKSEVEPSIVGKWELYQVGTIDNLEPAEQLCPTTKDYVEFVNGGVFRSVEFDDNCDEVFVENAGQWTKTGNSLQIIIDDTESQADILILDNTTLKIKETGGSWAVIYKRAS